MSKIKTFEDFLISNKGTLIHSILVELEPTIQKMIEGVQEHFKKNDMTFTSRDLELVRLNIIYDMLKSLEIYTEPTDELVDIIAGTSPKGNIEISAKIRRGQTTYSLHTEVIIAGGHNVQRAHYRYLTKTNLPKTGSQATAKQYAERIKKLTTEEKLDKEIQDLKMVKARNAEKIQNSSALSDDEIWTLVTQGKDFYETPSWEEIVQRGVAANYDNDRSKFEELMKTRKEEAIEFWKTKNIKWPSQHNDSLEKLIQKAEQKKGS